jgi:hypothetical protein
MLQKDTPDDNYHYDADGDNYDDNHRRFDIVLQGTGMYDGFWQWMRILRGPSIPKQ